jgi:hypothetical protein
MALTVTTVAGASTTMGNKKVRVLNIAFDSSYPTGGEPLTAADCGLKKIEQFIPHGVARGGTGDIAAVAVAYDHTNSKLFAYETSGTVDLAFKEATSTMDLSTYTDLRVTVIGF